MHWGSMSDSTERPVQKGHSIRPHFEVLWLLDCLWKSNLEALTSLKKLKGLEHLELQRWVCAALVKNSFQTKAKKRQCQSDIPRSLEYIILNFPWQIFGSSSVSQAHHLLGNRHWQLNKYS